MSGDEVRDTPADAPAGIYAEDGRPRFFSEPAVDRLVASFVALVGEVWVLTERIANMESMAAIKGVVSLDEIRNYKAADAEASARDAARDAYIKRVLGDLREQH